MKDIKERVRDKNPMFLFFLLFLQLLHLSDCLIYQWMFVVIWHKFPVDVYKRQVQVGLSLKSHDPSQRSNGFLTLAGGVIITFAKEILDLIMA